VPTVSERERVNILLVDDQPGKLLTYEMILSELDENLLKAASAREAFEVLLRTEVAVVLVDVCMPDLDGFELAAMIREHPRFRSTAIILVSAVLVDDVNRLRGYSSGAMDYLQVPVVPELLRAKVAVFVELYRKSRELAELNRELERRVLERTSELELAAQRLRASEEELRAAARRKDEFLAVLAHELRNPLAPIRTSARSLLLRPEVDADVSTHVEIIDRQVSHLARLIDDLLDVSRINTGRLELRRSRVTLSAILESALEISRPVIEQYDHTLSIELPTQAIYLEADLVRLAQVFMNLLNNAAKYTPKGGRIELSAALDPSDPARPAVIVTVRDTGIGLAPEQVPSVFEMFVRLENRHVRTEAGLGIGLALAQRLVELHQGQISAASEGLDKGSAFAVRLPVLSTPPLEPTRPAAPRDPTPARRLRVLVVDDLPDNSMSLGILLRRLGHEVEIADGGRQGLVVADRFEPQVVLLDIGMPDLDGYEVCRLMRQRPWAATARIVALTGWGQTRDREAAVEAGFDAHLVKPLDHSRLEEVLATYRDD
jgi:signal transduction histidine kinase